MRYDKKKTAARPTVAVKVFYENGPRDGQTRLHNADAEHYRDHPQRFRISVDSKSLNKGFYAPDITGRRKDGAVVMTWQPAPTTHASGALKSRGA